MLNTAVFAQLNSPVQIGRATHDLQDAGLSAAHFNIPLGSKVKISNAETGKEIEVTIRGRIPLSSTRIVDLSPAAWDALALTADTDVRLVPPPTPTPAAGGGIGASRAPVPAPAVVDQEGGQWFTIQVHPEASPVSSWEIKIIAGDEERQLTIQGRPTPHITGGEERQPAVQSRPAPQVTSWDEEEIDDEWGGEAADAYFPEYADEIAEENTEESAAEADYSALVLPRTPIKVVPGLPNPNSRKIYRLQVGAYARAETADVAECALKTAGFETRREARGSLTRVLAVGIAAADVKSAVQAIESAGFGEVWIRE